MSAYEVSPIDLASLVMSAVGVAVEWHICGDPHAQVRWLTSPDSAREDGLCFLDDDTPDMDLPGAVIIGLHRAPPLKAQACIVTDNPKLCFAGCAYSLVGEGPPPKITKGERVRIGEGVVIGARGMAYAQFAFGKQYIPMAHLGGVVIGDGVDIGPLTVVVRGILTDTEIGSGTKIGNRCTIGHNVKIGRNCFIAPGVCLGGSVRLEDGAYVGLGATVLNHVTVGEKAYIGAGSVVTKDVPAGKVAYGNPAGVVRDV
jgi:acetyltransferase-like isoleucine patch superfamily enzyme